uniref:Bifunctional protein NCOAT n=2 Tax=Lygus hesperus TaxID=30085 RepID=A0A0A9W5Q8_LYGHE
MYELYPYVWEMRAVISTLNSYIKWLGGGTSGHSSDSPAIGNYTWFSKGWKESFMSGEQEPWVFRGGLTADLQRLIPVDGGSDLFVYKVPQVVSSTIYTIREYIDIDKDQITDLSQFTRSSSESSPDHLERLVECILRLNPKLCFVVEEKNEGDDKPHLAGYAIAIANILNHSSAVEEVENDLEPWARDILKCCIAGAKPHHPSIIVSAIHPSVTDQSVSKRLIICLLAALRSNGSCGVFTPVCASNTQQLDSYVKLGFVEMSRDEAGQTAYLGRVF